MQLVIHMQDYFEIAESTVVSETFAKHLSSLKVLLRSKLHFDIDARLGEDRDVDDAPIVVDLPADYGISSTKTNDLPPGARVVNY